MVKGKRSVLSAEIRGRARRRRRQWGRSEGERGGRVLALARRRAVRGRSRGMNAAAQLCDGFGRSGARRTACVAAEELAEGRCEK